MAREKRDYNNPSYKKARAAARKRDGGKCVLCGCKKRLQIHHCTPYSNGGSHAVSNLVTLCRRCHKKVTGVELHYQELFMEIVRINSEG